MAVADRYMLFVVVRFQSCYTTKPNGILGFKPKKLGLDRAIKTKTSVGVTTKATAVMVEQQVECAINVKTWTRLYSMGSADSNHN